MVWNVRCEEDMGSKGDAHAVLSRRAAPFPYGSCMGDVGERREGSLGGAGVGVGDGVYRNWEEFGGGL